MSKPAPSVTDGLKPDCVAAIAQELRSLPDRRDSDAERHESAGRLLLVAIDNGAFNEQNHTPLVAMVRQRAEQTDVNGPISAWVEAVWLLRGKPNDRMESGQTFADDVGLVANELERWCGDHRTRTPRGKRNRAVMDKRRGSKPRYDAKNDARIARDFQASDLTIKDFANNRGMSYVEVKRTLDRNRKRQS